MANQSEYLQRYDTDALERLRASLSGYAETPMADITSMRIREAGLGLTDADAVPDVAEPVARRGDVWALGGHRLLCGDSTSPDDVRRLMGNECVHMVWTDPPYGVAVGDKNKWLNSVQGLPSDNYNRTSPRGGRITENLDNDDQDEDTLRRMLESSFELAVKYCYAGASWYVAAPPGPLHVIFGQTLKDLGIWRQTIQWVKNNSTFSPMGVCYHWQAEPIFFGWLPNGCHVWYGGRQQTTVWNIDRPTKSPEHPTMKPVELVRRAVENSTIHGESVYDLYVGSGTTIIACEQSGRVCRAMELLPRYVDVAIRRWELFTRQKAELLDRK